MKKLLLALLIIVILFVLAVVIFLATFDADRYRPQLVKQLEQALEAPVELERISLGWQRGIAVKLEGLTIYEKGADRLPLVQVESVDALVDLFPLLRRNIRISSVLLQHPSVHIVRDAQGEVNLTGLTAVASPAAASGKTATVGETAVSLNIDSLRIQQGSLHFTDFTVNPPLEFWLKALDVKVKNISPGSSMDIELQGALAADVQNIDFTGSLVPPIPPREGSIERIKLNVKELPLDRLLPVARPGEPRLLGTLSGSVEGIIPTLKPNRLLNELSGRGRLQLQNAKIENLNVIRAMFDEFSMLPGLIEKLMARLPQNYQEKLVAKDTLLNPIDLAVEVEANTARFDELDISTDTFRLTGTGRVGLDGSVDIRGILRIEPTLSNVFVRSVNELTGLADEQGAIKVPISVQGSAAHFVGGPDLNYIASKIIVTKAVDLLGEFLDKQLGAKEEAGAQEEPADSDEDLLGQFLKTMLGEEQPQSAPAP